MLAATASTAFSFFRGFRLYGFKSPIFTLMICTASLNGLLLAVSGFALQIGKNTTSTATTSDIINLFISRKTPLCGVADCFPAPVNTMAHNGLQGV